MGTIITTVIIIGGLMLAFIWTRSANRKVGGKCSQADAGCASCSDSTCSMSAATQKEAGNTKKYKGVFFDLDGTLLDTSGDLTDAVNYIRQTSGLESVSEDDVIPKLGGGVQNLLKNFLHPDISDDEFSQKYKEFTEFYRANAQNKTYAYDGIKSLMENLKDNGYTIAVISNKNDDAAKILTGAFFPGLVDFTLGRTDFLRKKPDPAMMRFVLSKLEVDTGDIIYIGDSEVDYEFAMGTGVDCVLVSWGFRSKDRLLSLGNPVIIDKPEQLYGLL